MAIRRRKALLGGGALTPYVDLWFSAGSFRVGSNQVGTLTGLAGYTFTGASLRMGFGPTGYLTYGPNNLAIRSQEIVGGTGSWIANGGSTQTGNFIAAPDGTVTASRIVADGTNVNQGVYLSALSVVGRTDIFSIYLKGAVGGEQVWIGDASSRYQATLTTSWQRFTNPRHAMVSPHNVVYALNNTAMTFYAWGAQLEAVTYQTTPSTYYPTTSAAYYGARLVYDPVTLASLGILVEEARTNVCLRSQTFDNATWTKMAGIASVTADATVSPDGTQNAELFTEDSGSSYKVCYQSIASAAGTYTGSVFFKAGSGSTRYMRIVISSSSINYGYITANMSTGAITQAATANGTASAASGSCVSVGGGWYRLYLTVTLAASMDFMFLEPYDTGTPAAGSDYGRLTYTGNGSTWSLWQAQLEAGTGASSPIPTTTASVTRAADVPNLAFNMPLTSTWVVEYQCAFLNASRQEVAGISDSGNSRFMIRGPANGIAPILAIGNGSSVTSITGSSTVAAGVATKMAALVDSLTTNADFVMNGAAAVTGSVQLASATTGAQTMRIGTNETGGGSLNGTIKRLQVYPVGLSAAKQQVLTT